MLMKGLGVCVYCSPRLRAIVSPGTMVHVALELLAFDSIMRKFAHNHRTHGHGTHVRGTEVQQCHPSHVATEI